jgi:catechol 2,3-dioxygenase-like lactoylglutathione lyase family enzyme
MKFKYSPHIAINVKDRDKAADFYGRVLGMEYIEEKHGDKVLSVGPLTFYVSDGQPGQTFFEFKVDNVSEARKLLEEEGCKVTHEYSEKSVMVSDPYGMNFHIWEDGADFDNQ